MKLKVSLLIISTLFSLCIGLFVPTHKTTAQCGVGPTCDAGTQQPTEGVAGSYLTLRRAIVPCGRKCDDTRTDYDERCNCTLCHLLIMAKNIFDLLLAWLIIVSLVMLTVAGVLFILSSGNASIRQVAKTIVARTLAGFGIFVLSWLIVYTILVFISADPDTGGGMLGLGSGGTWYEFTCDTDNSPFERVPPMTP
jgi:hypothetical protein